MKITKEMKVCDIIDLNQGLEKIFEKHGLLCVGCPGAMIETLKEAAEGHGINVDKLLEDLNKEA